jgi:hypothetical protein
MLACGCYDAAASAKVRAAHEFDCPTSAIEATQREDLSPDTVDIDACGFQVRYTCPVSRYQPRTCIREPTDPQ